MKKLIIIVCVFALLVFMVGCLDKNSNDDYENTASDKINDDNDMNNDIDDNDMNDGDNDIDDNIVSFMGVIAEINGNVLIVTPNEDERIRESGDSVSISLDLTQMDTLAVGDTIRVEYDGDVMESYPLQINVIKAEKVD